MNLDGPLGHKGRSGNDLRPGGPMGPKGGGRRENGRALVSFQRAGRLAHSGKGDCQ